MYKKIGIVACSNPEKASFKSKMIQLCAVLQNIGFCPVLSDYIYDNGNGFSGTGKERADSVMKFYRDPEIEAIFDISGGDMANEILPYLDFNVIAENNKPFCGYSDLTTIVNAIMTITGEESILYQVKNLIYDHGKEQAETLKSTFFNKTNELYDFEYSFVQKDKMEGNLIGGNIRCFLKLAGTQFMPNFRGKILLLESFGGGVPQMVTYLCQLKLLGAFEKINGILLGTFSKMEGENLQPDIISLVKSVVGENIPIAKTSYIGHGTNSKAAVIGRYYSL